MTQTSPALTTIKELNWLQSTVSFYVVKRRLVQKQARYDVLLVNIGNDIQQKLKNIFNERLIATQGVMDYDFHTIDQDDNLLTLPVNETDFQQVIDIITAEESPPIAATQEQIFDAWFYVARFDIPNQPALFAVRKAPRGWATRKSCNIANLIFSENMELILENKAVFKIDDYFDFFSFLGTVFIFYKNAFEIDLNFRAGIAQDKDDVITELQQLNVFQTTDGMGEFIGQNLRLLRKAAKVKQLGYFRDTTFLESLRLANSDRNLGLEYDDDDKLIMSSEKIELILHLFTNGRVESIINHELFDVDAKRRVEGD